MHEAPKDFGAFRTALHRQSDTLSPHLKRIAEYILGEPVRFAFQTAAEAARRVEVQPSTLVRFAKLFGFSGFSELQQLFRRRLIEGELSFDPRLRPRRKEKEGEAGSAEAVILDACADASIRAVRRMQTHLDMEALGQAVHLLKRARAIHVFGHGRAFAVAACLAHGLIERRYRCRLLEAIPGTVGRDVLAMDGTDLIVAFALDGVAQSLDEGIALARTRGVSILGITDAEFNALTRLADACLVVRTSGEEDSPALVAHTVLVQALVSAVKPHGEKEGEQRDAGI